MEIKRKDTNDVLLVIDADTLSGVNLSSEKTFFAEYSYTSKQNLIDEIEQAIKEKNI